MNTAAVSPSKQPAAPPRLSRRIYPVTRVVEAFVSPLLVLTVLFASVLFGVEAPWPIDPAYLVLGLILFSLTFPGSFHLDQPTGTMVRRTLAGWLVVVAALWLFAYGSGYASYFPPTVMLACATLTPLALVGANGLARAIVPGVLAQPRYRHRAVIAGCNATGRRLAQSFDEDPTLGVHFTGYFDDRGGERGEPVGEGSDVGHVGHVGHDGDVGNVSHAGHAGHAGHAVRALELGPLAQLPAYIQAHHIDQIYLALPLGEESRILKLLDELKDTTASIYFVPDLFVTDLIQGRVDSIGSTPIIALCESPFVGIHGLMKRASDVVLAALILTAIAPLMLLVGAGVKLMSPGPALFTQRRYGLDGREIVVYKFRSMTVTEDGAGSYTQVTRDDARVPPFGAFIRRYSLDELPQFINVLQGRMSIVGPRPHAIAVNERYRKLIPGYMVRHKVPPGITGWAQVNGYRGGDDPEHMRGRIEYDLEYLRNWSLGLDLRIILRTVGLVFRDTSAY